MPNKIIYITAALLAAAVIHPVYTIDRIKTCRDNKTGYSIEALENLASVRKNTAKSVTSDTLYSELVSGSIPPAVFIVGSPGRKIISAYYDELLMGGSREKQEAVKEFENPSGADKKPGYIIKNLNISSAPGRAEFIIAEKNTGSEILFAVFSRGLTTADIIVLILENALILSLITAGAAMIYIVNSRKKKYVYAGSDPAPRASHNAGEEQVPDSYPPGKPKEDIPQLDPLSSLVYDFFSKILPALSLDEISLYLYNRPGRLTKVYELKGSRLIKIDGGEFDCIDITPDALTELKNSSFLLVDSGKNLQIPLKKLDSLIGLIRIIRNKPLGGPEIQKIITAASGLLKPMSDTISINEVMIDPATGLNSSAYLNMKISELRQSSTRFTAAALSVFNESRTLQDEDKFKVIKTIAPAVTDLLKGGSFAALRGDYIIVIFTGEQSLTAPAETGRLVRELDRYRIKLRPDLTVQIRSSAGICGSDETAADIVSEAAARVQ